MNSSHSDKVQALLALLALLAQLQAVMDRHIDPNGRAHDDRVDDPHHLWRHWPS